MLDHVLFPVVTISECIDANLPCVNGGTCEVQDGSLVCICLAGYTGDFCEGKAESLFQYVNVVVTRPHFCTFLQVCVKIIKPFISIF